MREEIAKYVRLLYERDLTSALSGNVSVRLQQAVLISPTKVPRFRVQPDDVSVVTMAGEHLEGKPPSSELPIHLAIYNATEHTAIVHAHSRFATALSCLEDYLEPPDVEGKHFLGRVPLITYAEPGTQELGDLVAQQISTYKGALLQNHGLIAVGGNLEQAFIFAEAIERTAQLIFDLRVVSRR